MGLDYSFEIVADRSQAEQVLRAVADRLEPGERAWMLTCLPLPADPTLQAAWTDPFTRQLFVGGGVCLGFLFPLDAHLLEYAKTSPIKPDAGHLRVGCVYCKMRFGDRLVVFTATAATTDMSVLFSDSAGINETFRGIAIKAGARVLFFDDEGNSYHSLWPEYADVEMAGGYAEGNEIPLDDRYGEMLAKLKR